MNTLMASLGYSFQDPQWLERALTHKSYAHEKRAPAVPHNERLEFLGDAVLDLALSDFLYRQFPEAEEGHLSKWRASMVNTQVLAQLATDLGLPLKMRLGKGESETGGAEKPRLLACCFEALIGAIYLDSSFESCQEVVERLFSPLLSRLDVEHHFREDYKTRFQEVAQSEWKTVPNYQVIKEEGPDHAKVFYVELRIADRVLATGEGSSKKAAEQAAAREALEAMS